MNDIGVIHLSNGGFSIVDSDKFDYLNQFRWYKNAAGHIAGTIKGLGEVLLHRVINNTPKGKHTDHKNRCRFDNRRSNLRSCLQSENNQNKSKHPNSTSEFKGVSFDKTNSKWICQLSANGKHYWGGRFKIEVEAAKRFNEMAPKIHGEFAVLNKI